MELAGGTMERPPESDGEGPEQVEELGGVGAIGKRAKLLFGKFVNGGLLDPK